MKIDKRRHYILILDTETANTQLDAKGRLDPTNVLMYDCGFAVIDTHGKVYETYSFINRDIFMDERKLMLSAYYADKIPQYVQGIRDKSRIVADTWTIRKTMLDVMKKYNITEVAAHNARFDYSALNAIIRWVSKSKYRYWFPYGTVMWDTMKMARSVILPKPTYQRFCRNEGFMTAQGRPRLTAEVLYRFITNDPSFKESHTGLEDVLIEKTILEYCYRQKKAMKKLLWEGK